MADDKEILALISLIDDPNAEIYKVVEQKLINKGKDIIETLEDAWGAAENQIFQERVESIIQKIQFSDIYNDLKSWSQSDAQDLLTGAYYIAKIHYPNISYEEVLKQYDAVKKDIWLEINDNLTALEKVKILNHIIFDVHKFSKTQNVEEFYSISNCMISRLLETKKGNPISLSILYASLAQELGLPIYGVNLPKNFILGYKDLSEFTKNSDDFTDNVLFYINPYNKGSVFGKREIDYYLEQMKIEQQDSYYQICTNKETLERLILTLIHAYNKSDNNEKKEQMKQIFALFSSGKSSKQF